MDFKLSMGVDMSKSWFHFCIMDKQLDIIFEGEVVNQPDDIFKFISTLFERLEIESLATIHLCMEHTGIYVQHLIRCWMTKGGTLSLVPATKISDQLAGKQGWEEKSDAIDARRIAEYAIRYSDQLEPWKLKGDVLAKLQILHRLRERLIKAVNLLKVPAGESQFFDTAFVSEALAACQERSVTALQDDIKNIDKELDKIIKEDEYVNRLFKLITSVDGVGKVTAREILITTSAFTDFKPEQAKKYARYAGVVPLTKSSGTSVRKRNRISKRANKKIKATISMGALSVTRSSSELGQYYRRKISEGKDHMTVLNAVRNKIILRIFAVVRNDTMYEKNYTYNLVKP